LELKGFVVVVVVVMLEGFENERRTEFQQLLCFYIPSFLF